MEWPETASSPPHLKRNGPPELSLLAAFQRSGSWRGEAGGEELFFSQPSTLCRQESPGPKLLTEECCEHDRAVRAGFGS